MDTAKKTILEHILYPAKRVDKEKLYRAVRHKTILITGATYGIGESIAYKLAQKDVTLILTARTEEKLRSLKNELEQTGATIYIFPANLQDENQVDDLLAYIHSLPCTVDIFISNAGKSICRPIQESLDRFHDFTRTMSLNYYAPVKISLDLIPHLQKNKGHLINISSVSTLFLPAPHWAAYEASKSAFNKWIGSVAPELRVKNVAVTSVYLPLVRTRMIAPTEMYRNTPAMQPSQVAEIICKSIIKRNRKYSPWWTFPVEVLSLIFRRPYEAFMLYYMKKRSK